MSVDPVIYHLTEFRRWAIEHPDVFSESARGQVLLAVDVMQAYLKKEDVRGFDRCVDELLAQKPDMADFILNELFERCGINDRDELSSILAAT